MRMMKAFIYSLVLSSFLLMSSAQASLLWKISGNDLEQPSYLFGTIHLICGGQFYMDDRIENAVSETDTLMLEIDLTDTATMMRLQQLMVNPQGPYLQEHLSESQLSSVDEFFIENFGAGVAQLGVLKPMALHSMVLVAGMPCTDIKSYEVVLSEMAGEQDMAITELETVEFQMSLFDNIPLQEQVEWLWTMIDEEGEAQAQMAAMVDAYLGEDLEALLTLMKDDPQFSEYFELLLDDRNVNWVAPIREQIHAQSTFIAVGAGHLPGEMGMIELLREAGYEVEAVSR